MPTIFRTSSKYAGLQPVGTGWWRPNYYRSFGFYQVPRFAHPHFGWRIVAIAGAAKDG